MPSLDFRSPYGSAKRPLMGHATGSKLFPVAEAGRRAASSLGRVRPRGAAGTWVGTGGATRFVPLIDLAAGRKPLLRALGVTAVTTVLVTALSYGLPDAHAATGVGLTFLIATYVLVLRSDDNARVRHYGLSLGGLLESEPIDPRRLLRDALGALGWAALMAAIFFPPFWLGYVLWWQPSSKFVAPPLATLASDALGQLLVIALPEEAFYRGYLLTTLDDHWPPERKLLGARVGLGLIVSSALFAVGHVLTEVHPNRLAVFFPALLFGFLRARSGGIGAALLFHAMCNLFASYVARGYGFPG